MSFARLEQDAVLSARYLETHSRELRPRGPLVDVLFESPTGPLGLQIVNIPCLMEDFEIDRVIVAGGARNTPAFGRVFFGDQVMFVGGVNCLGLKMKEVRLLIADSARPLKMVLQPLCIGDGLSDFPLCPPLPSTSPMQQRQQRGKPPLNKTPSPPPPSPTTPVVSPEVWALMTRPYALKEAGEKRQVQCRVGTFSFATLDDESFFVTSCSTTADGGLLAEGDLIISCNHSTTVAELVKELLVACAAAAAAAKDKKLVELCVVRAEVSSTITCAACGSDDQWLFSRFCAQCGTKLANAARRM